MTSCIKSGAVIVVSKRIKILSILISLLLSPALSFADSPGAGSLRVSDNICVSAIKNLVGSVSSAVDKLAKLLVMTSSARLPPIQVSPGTAGTESYTPWPPETLRVHFVQVLPGLSKLARKHLTAEELNKLLNQIRGLFLLAMSGVNNWESVLMDYKSMRANVPSDEENPEIIKDLLLRIEEILRESQPQLNSERFGDLARAIKDSRLIIMGSGQTERQAIYAGRFSSESFSRWEDVREVVAKSISEISELSSLIRKFMDEKSPALSSALLEGADNFTIDFFKILRNSESATELSKTLQQIDPSLKTHEVKALAENMFRFFEAVDRFIPGTQYQPDQLEVVDHQSNPRDHSYPEGTQSLIVIDVKSVGARILKETYESIKKALSSDSGPEAFRIDELIEAISIENSVAWLNASIKSTIQKIKESEGENLLGYWHSGDEVVFYLRSPSTSRATNDTEASIRLVETQLAGIEAFNALERAQMREIGEYSLKTIESDFSELQTRSAKLFIEEGKPVLHIYIKSRNSSVRESVLKAHIREKIKQKFSGFRGLETLKIEFFVL